MINKLKILGIKKDIEWLKNNVLSKSFALTDMPKIMIADNIIMRFIFLIYLKLCNKLLEPQKCLRW